jgi:CrcB protein
MIRRTSWDVIAAVAAGGALGAAARYGVGLAWPHPWATLAINVTGCFMIGALVELSPPHRLARPFLATGVLGGFTTFSTYAVETRTLIATGRPGAAAAYVVGTLIAALVAVRLGMYGVRLLRRPR